MADNEKRPFNYDDTYFAAKDAKDAASVILGKADSFFDILESNSYLSKLKDMWRAYHGSYSNYLDSSHKINFTGEQGELVQVPINHFRNIAQHIYVMITTNRPVMEARAVNTDYKSYAQTILANGILDYYMREKKLEDAIKKATELSIVLGSGYIKLAWNATAGEIYDTDPDTGEAIREGELEFSTLTPFDVVIDGSKENWDNDWILVRSFKNRYDLMAKYPDLSDKIRGIRSKTDASIYKLVLSSNDETDDIPVYEFFHRQTESMPEGRYLLFLDSDCILLDTKMPYRVIPVFRIAPNEILGTPYGYTPMFDIFPIQEGINSLYSTIMSNQNAFGVQNIFVPRGADITVSNLQGGLNVIEANAEPKPLNLTETPAEIFKFLEMLVQAAETISGISSVTRGNPEASLKSGTALALVQSQSLQFISGLAQSYVKLIEDVGTAVIQILKDFANTPKVVALVGKNNRPLLKEFTGEKISAINRVVVDMGNPLARTVAGRVQMAEQMLQMQIIKNPQQYFQVINTGRLENMFEGEMDELLLIKKENEQLLEGINPLISPLDKHSMHIMEHRSVLSDPDLRNDPNLVKTVMDHIEGHKMALQQVDPSLLQMIGEQPLVPPQPPMPPQGGAAPGNSPMPDIMTPESQQMNIQGQGPQVPGGQNVSLPNMPQIPADALANPALQQEQMGNVNFG